MTASAWLRAGVAMSALATVVPTAVAIAAAPRPPAPALPTELRTVEVASSAGIVVCSSEVAARAGASVLAAGGNAVDAAVAAAFALGVGEYGASGLGGQTYMLICPASAACVAIDGSAVAPLRASRLELLHMREADRFYGHRVASTPATLAALALALERYGTRPLAEVMAPAIAAADTGVSFSKVMRTYTEGYLAKLRESAYLRNLLLRDGLDLWEPTHVYCLPDLACTLRRIAEGGPDVFYTGEIAAEIATDMRAHGGWLQRDDLGRVRATVREPAVGSYRGLEVVSFPLPGAGGALVETLQILDAFPAERLRAAPAERWALQVEATRLAMADDSRVKTPTTEAGRVLTDPARARERAREIRVDRALTREELGDNELTPWSDRDTTQLSVADRYGNAVAVTQTLGRIYGAYDATSGLGFPYNGMLEGFDYEHPESRSYLLPLRPAFTTQAPTILRRDGRPFLVLGSVGSGRILSGIVLAISNVVDRGMTLGEAVAAPRVLWGGNQENKIYLEIAGDVTDAVADALAARGYADIYRLRFPPRQGDLNAFGCVNAIMIERDGSTIGVGDVRRGGVAVAADGTAGGASPSPACWRSLWVMPSAPGGGR